MTNSELLARYESLLNKLAVLPPHVSQKLFMEIMKDIKSVRLDIMTRMGG